MSDQDKGKPDPYAGPWNYGIALDDDGVTYVAENRKTGSETFPSDDPFVTLQAALDALASANVPGTVTHATQLVGKTPIVVRGNGNRIRGTGWAKAGDPSPSSLQLSDKLPKEGEPGFIESFVTMLGRSSVIEDSLIDGGKVSRRAYYVPKQGESFENSSNRVGVQSSAVRGGTEYAVLWYGSDGWWSNGEIRFANNQPNGKAALYNDSNNFNIGGVTHVHGAGRGAEGRVAVFAGPALNSNGVHYESGNDADNAWVVESAGNKQSISGGKFGRTDQGGELLVRKQARPTVTGVVFMAEDLDYDNLYDMVRVQGKSAGVTLAGCDMRFGGSDNEAGDNYPRYAINRDKQTRPVIVTGCLLAGRTAPWNREPTTQGQNVWDNGTDMVALAATDSAEVIPSPGRGNVATPPPEGVTVEDEDADNGDE